MLLNNISITCVTFFIHKIFYLPLTKAYFFSQNFTYDLFISPISLLHLGYTTTTSSWPLLAISTPPSHAIKSYQVQLSYKRASTTRTLIISWWYKLFLGAFIFSPFMPSTIEIEEGELGYWEANFNATYDLKTWNGICILKYIKLHL